MALAHARIICFPDLTPDIIPADTSDKNTLTTNEMNLREQEQTFFMCLNRYARSKPVPARQRRST